MGITDFLLQCLPKELRMESSGILHTRSIPVHVLKYRKPCWESFVVLGKKWNMKKQELHNTHTQLKFLANVRDGTRKLQSRSPKCFWWDEHFSAVPNVLDGPRNYSPAVPNIFDGRGLTGPESQSSGKQYDVYSRGNPWICFTKRNVNKHYSIVNN